MKNKTTDEKGKGIFSNRIVLLLLSFLLAVACWIAVVATVSTEQTTTIYNVPITVPTSASYHSYGVEIVGRALDDITVDITVKGDRSIISSLRRDSFTITPIFTAVTEPGTYELPLQIVQANRLLTFEITHVSLSSVKLTFAEVAEQEFPITVSTENISPADGYLVAAPVLTSSNITISGPRTELVNISRVVAELKTVTTDATATITENCALQLYDANDRKLDSSNFTMSLRSVDVTVPVYKLGIIKLDISFTNVPEGFDISTLHYQQSVSELRVAASPSVLDAATMRTVGYIDLSSVDLDKTYQFDVQLPSGMLNVDGITAVTVRFETDALSTKKINIASFHIQGGAEELDYQIETPSLNGVAIIADKATIDTVSGGSATAVIDATEIAAEPGTYNVPVSIIIPGHPSAWAVGSYTVTVKVSRK